jgi:hypothetical protein
VGERAALYCCVFTADQSCDRQERDLRTFTQRGGFEIVGVSKEKASGAKADRIERKKVMALAQAREIDAILVTELSRCGRSTIDLVQTLQAWDVSVLAISGLQAADPVDNGYARAGGAAVDMHSAGAAERHAAAELRAGHAEHVTQHSEKRRVAVDIDGVIHAVDLNRRSHIESPFRGQVDDPAMSRRIFPPRCTCATASLIAERG